MGIFLYLIGIASTYFIIKYAVKHAINEILVENKSTIKTILVKILSGYEYKDLNK